MYQQLLAKLKIYALLNGLRGTAAHILLCNTLRAELANTDADQYETKFNELFTLESMKPRDVKFAAQDTVDFVYTSHFYGEDIIAKDPIDIMTYISEEGTPGIYTIETLSI